MKSTDLIRTITQEADEDRELRLLAAQRMADLEAQHSDRLQKLLTGAALATDQSPWTMSVNTSHFAAKWRDCKTYADLCLNLTIQRVESWSALTPLFDILDSQGIDASNWTSEDDARSYSRIYTNTVLDDEATGQKIVIRITASLPGDTETCKRVIVGYTHPESHIPQSQPIYELHCEGGN